MAQVKLPEKLLKKHPDLTKNEIKAIWRVFLRSINYRISQGYILDFKVPGVGRFKTHGNKQVRRKKDMNRRDKKRKRDLAKKASLKKENLLW